MMVTIIVSDIDRSIAFYTEVLNCKIQFRFGNEWAQLRSLDGVTIGLHPASPKSPPGVKGSITIGIMVEESIGNMVDEMKAKGVKFNGPIIDEKQVLIAKFEDPDGNPFYLAQPKQQWGGWDAKAGA